MLKNNKGVSLITAIITVTVIIILLSTIVYSTLNNIEVKKINELYSDLRVVTDAVQLYYVKHNKLPIGNEKYTVTAKKVIHEKSGVVTNISSVRIARLDFILSSGNVFNKEKLFNPNDYDNTGEVDKAVYYKVELSLLDNITLTNSGTYLVNERSKTIYYYDGVDVNGKSYHALPLTYIDIPYDEKENGTSVSINSIYLPIYRTKAVSLNLKDFLEYDKEPRDVSFSKDITSKDYFSVDSENGIITSTKSLDESLIISADSVGKVNAEIYSYGTTETQTLSTNVYVTEIYLEDENTIITDISDELKDIYIPVGEGSYKNIKVYKNGAAGNLNFMLNNDTIVTYESLDETENENGRKYNPIKISSKDNVGNTILTIIEDNGNAYKILNIHTVNPDFKYNDSIVEKATNEVIDGVLIETKRQILVEDLLTHNIVLSGLDDIDWTKEENSIEWELESLTEGVEASSIFTITENENTLSFIKNEEIDGNVNLNCTIIINNIIVKKIIQPIQLDIPK